MFEGGWPWRDKFVNKKSAGKKNHTQLTKGIEARRKQGFVRTT